MFYFFYRIVLLLQGGTVQVRFQPRIGKYLAAVSQVAVKIFDFDTFMCVEQLQVIIIFLHPFGFIRINNLLHVPLLWFLKNLLLPYLL